MLHLHRAERADALVDALRELLATPPADPFAPDVVSVPTRGMERWLTQRLSHGLGATAGREDGICANVDFPPPGRLLDDAVAQATGIDPERDTWRPERLVWPLLEIVDAALQEPWLADLRSYLAQPSRRFPVIRHVAGLFERYALQRPELLTGWLDGEDTGAGWQAELYRRVHRAIPLPGPVERRAAACAALAADGGRSDLPERLSAFGLTRLPAARREVLDALAVHREVHLFLLHPSPVLWDKVAQLGPPASPRRAEDVTRALPANRLLASWGQDARELQLTSGTGAAADHHHPVDAPTGTLLERLQADVRADREPPGAPLRDTPDARALLDPDDRSVQVHACHGRARQVEVVRDAILHLLEDDPTLEPRDILVMCPDIEHFAPLVQATFGSTAPVAGEADEDLPELPGVDLRVRLADRALRQTNPVLGVAARLLELADGRAAASDVLDLADREPVRRRFRFDDDDLGRLEEWVAKSGIRWGLDAERRAPFKLRKVAAGTWEAGLDRLLLGITMSEDDDRLFADVLPLDDVESASIELAGRFAEFVARLTTGLDRLRAAGTVAEWMDALGSAADALTATSARDAWQRAELAQLLGDVGDEAGGHGGKLTLAEVRAMLAERLQGRPTRANFRTGHLTVCTLMPMRSVPHRVVCLLGLDDQAFPRSAPRDGDDVLLTHPHVGDRDARMEDRQLLLDALLAATDRVIVTYAGNDERTNVALPPAVPVGELLDAVDRTVRTADGPPASRRILVRHPLQPFDPRNFVAGELVTATPWSFDTVALAGARALEQERAQAPPFLPVPLGPPDEAVTELGDLVRFAVHPVKAFLRERLGVALFDDDDEVLDALPVELDALEEWSLGDRLLGARRRGVGRADAEHAERVRGLLPPGEIGARLLRRISPRVEAINAMAAPGTPETVDVSARLPDGRRVVGTVVGVVGDVVQSLSYSTLGPKHRVAAWVRLLALVATDPDRDWVAVTIGRKGNDARVSRITPPTDDRAAWAAGQLEILLDLRARGLREVPPLACKTSEGYAWNAQDRRRSAGYGWNSGDFPGEQADLEHRLVHGRVLTLDELLAPPPRDDERWFEDEASRFGQWSRRLWTGLLERERVGSG